jgi:SAM-dependent methyltransferase
MACCLLSAADFVPYAEARPLLNLAPVELRNVDAPRFAAWLRAQDQAIRGRLVQGDLDTLVHLLLFGTSFTAQPRMTVENLAAESRAGLLRARLDDLLLGLAMPKGNQRLQSLQALLLAQGRQPGDAATGAFVLEQLQRVLRERLTYAERARAAGSTQSLFAQRGVSLDATILPNYGIDRALAELKSRGLLRQVQRVAILGPGLDFVDKEAGFDYYPPQTLQPFAVLDSLARWGLAKSPQLTVLDISPRVLDHVRRAKAGGAYTMQLPRKREATWTEDAVAYWQGFGTTTGREVAAMATPPTLAGVVTRAVQVPQRVVPTMDAQDVNIVAQRLRLPAARKYDLVVATNILVYYGPFEQALAMANIAAMLAPGGVLLTNDPLPEVPSVRLRMVGQTVVRYTTSPESGDAVYWYRDR